MPFKRSIPVVLVIVISAIVTGFALHLLIGDKRTQVGESVTRNGVTVTLQSVNGTESEVTLAFLISGLPTDRVTGSAVGILPNQISFKYNGQGLERPGVGKHPVGPHEMSLTVTFDTVGGETGELEIGRIYVPFSQAEGGGEDRFVEGPWSFRLRTPEGPYR